MDLPVHGQLVESRAPKFRRQYVGDSLRPARWQRRMRQNRYEPAKLAGRLPGFMQALPALGGKSHGRARAQEPQPRRTASRGQGFCPGQRSSACQGTRRCPRWDASQSRCSGRNGRARQACSTRRIGPCQSCQACCTVRCRSVGPRRMAKTPRATPRQKPPPSRHGGAGVYLGQWVWGRLADRMSRPGGAGLSCSLIEIDRYVERCSRPRAVIYDGIRTPSISISSRPYAVRIHGWLTYPLSPT